MSRSPPILDDRLDKVISKTVTVGHVLLASELDSLRHSVLKDFSSLKISTAIVTSILDVYGKLDVRNWLCFLCTRVLWNSRFIYQILSLHSTRSLIQKKNPRISNVLLSSTLRQDGIKRILSAFLCKLFNVREGREKAKFSIRRLRLGEEIENRKIDTKWKFPLSLHQDYLLFYPSALNIMKIRADQLYIEDSDLDEADLDPPTPENLIQVGQRNVNSVDAISSSLDYLSPEARLKALSGLQECLLGDAQMFKTKVEVIEESVMNVKVEMEKASEKNWKEATKEAEKLCLDFDVDKEVSNAVQLLIDWSRSQPSTSTSSVWTLLHFDIIKEREMESIPTGPSQTHESNQIDESESISLSSLVPGNDEDIDTPASMLDVQTSAFYPSEGDLGDW